MHWMWSLFHFRNADHEQWFFVSVATLLLSFIGSCFHRYSGSNKRYWPLLMGTWAHLGIASMATVVVLIKKLPSEVFSTDCIWYNSLLAVIYLLMYWKFRPKTRTT